MERGRVFCACLVLSCLLAACQSMPPMQIGPALRTYHDPSFGWVASVPADWVSCDVPGGRFTRGLPTSDPTKLYFWTYYNRAEDTVLNELVETGGVTGVSRTGEWDAPTLRWARYRGGTRDDPRLAVEFGLAPEGSNTHLILLLALQSETPALVETVLRPATQSFISGPPDAPASILLNSPPEPDYWPTTGFRTTSPDLQAMNGASLDSLVALIQKESLPIDSVTVIRHGYIILNRSFPPYQLDQLHELHSATKSITSMLVGIALADAGYPQAPVPSVNTPVLEILAPWHAANVDDRKRAMQLQHLLAMTAGLDWKEWDAAYERGTGNSLVIMVDTAPNWTQYVLDRPMADDPGDRFVYNSGASYLLSSVVSRLTQAPASALATQRLFAPLGVREFEWSSGPEQVTMGWGSLKLRPEDLARLGLLALYKGKWDGQQIIPAKWMEASTTDQVRDPAYEYGYQWWLDVADGYAFMSGRFGQTVIVAPRQDMVIVITAHLPDNVAAAVGVPRWLAEKYIISAAN